MVEISCYYIHSNRNTRYMVFIRYDKYMKILLSSYRTIILSIEDFMKIPHLFEYYLLSIFLTENVNKITYEYDNYNKKEFILSVEKNWKEMYFLDYYSLISIIEIKRNPFNSQEPKKQTSSKKINKFIKNFYKDFDIDPIYILMKLLDLRCIESKNIIDEFQKKEKYVNIFTGIKKGYGIDVYNEIIKYI